MADKEYVVRLVVNGSGAKTELADFIAKGNESSATMKRAGKSFEDLQAKSDPVFKALLTQQREVAKATKIAGDAVRLYGVDQAKANEVIRKTSEYYGVNVTKAREAAAATSSLAAANSSLAGRVNAVSAGLVAQIGMYAKFAALPIVFSAVGVLSGKPFIDATIEQEKVLAQLDAVIRSTGGAAGLATPELTAMATELQRMTTYSDEAVVGAQALLLTFTRIGKDVFPQATEAVLNISTAMGKGLNESAVLVGKALNDPMKGLTALTRVGIQFSNSQKEQIKVAVEAGNTFAAQKIILAELETQFGGSAKAARDTLGGSLTALKNAFGDLFEVGGPAANNLRDSIERLVKVLSDPSTISAIQNFGASLFDAFSGAIDAAKRLGFIWNQMKNGDFSGLLAPTDMEAAKRDLKIGLGSSMKDLDVSRFYDAVGFGGAKNTGGRIPGADADMERKLNDYEKLTKATQKQISALEAEAKTYGMSIAAAETFRKEQELLTAAELSKITVTEAMRHEIKALAATYGEARSAAAQLNAQHNADFELLTVGLDGVEKQITAIQKRLHGDDWQKFMNDGLSTTMRLTDEMGKLKKATDSFGSSLLSSIISGQAPLKALTGAAQQLISTLASDALKRVQGGGSLFGNANLGSLGGVATLGSAGLAGYQSGSPLGGALGGAMAGATFGPAGMAIGAVIGGVAGLFGQASKAKKEEEERIERAKEAWRRAQASAETFLAAMNGVSQGSLKLSIQDAQSRGRALWDAAWEAGEFGAEKQLKQAFLGFTQRVTHEFVKAFPHRIKELLAGIGPDSAYERARANIKSVGDQLLAFVADTEYTLKHIGEGDVNAARQATLQYALTLLDLPKQFSETETAIQTLNGQAAELQTVLQKLGMSSADAAAAIAGKLNDAISRIRLEFENGLVRKLNDATGKGYINEISDLVDWLGKARQDAAALGMSTDLIDQVFSAQAQEIIDGAYLVGNAFNDLKEQFPDLVDAVKNTVKELQEYIESLSTSDLSTLSPQEKLASAQAIYDETFARAQDGDSAALKSITQDADQLLKLAKDFYASSAPYTAIYDTVVAQLKGIGGFELGGRVMGGTPGVDSVPILAQQDEFIVNANAARRNMPLLEAINSGITPRGFANGGVVSARSFNSAQTVIQTANTNSAEISEFGKIISRTIAASASEQIAVLRSELGSLRAEVRRLDNTTRIEASRPPRPGNKAA